MAGDQGTIKASPHNLVMEASLGAASVTIDTADLAERGATITLNSGVWYFTGDYYYELIPTPPKCRPGVPVLLPSELYRNCVMATDPQDPDSFDW